MTSDITGEKIGHGMMSEHFVYFGFLAGILLDDQRDALFDDQPERCWLTTIRPCSTTSLMLLRVLSVDNLDNHPALFDEVSLKGSFARRSSGLVRRPA